MRAQCRERIRPDSSERVAGTTAHILFLLLIRPAHSEGQIKKKIKIMIKNKSPDHTFARFGVCRPRLRQINRVWPNLRLVITAAQH